MYDICDMHSHILPAMDDGCATAEESLTVLKQMQAAGITKVFATPHYYPEETVEDFLQRRQQSLAVLLAQTDGVSLPEICCGAEVAWFAGMDSHPEIAKLCLGNSRYILLELPFSPWSKQVIRDVSNLCLRGFTPILAHFERYGHQKPDAIQKILQCDVLLQMNAATILGFWQGRKACKAIKQGAVQLLGSDCHGLHVRPPRLGEAILHLEKKKLHNALSQMEALSNEIFRDSR